MAKTRRNWGGRKLALRLLSLILSIAMLLPGVTGVPARAAETAVPYPVSANGPLIFVEANAVYDSFNELTGFLEVALKVQTEVYYDVSDSVNPKPVTNEAYQAAIAADSGAAAYYELRTHKFRQAAVALQFDAEVLYPVNWDVEKVVFTSGIPSNAIDITNAGDMIEDVVELETARPPEVNASRARVSQYDDVNHTAVLALEVAVGGEGKTYAKPTTLLVVRFAYNLEATGLKTRMKAPVPPARAELLVPEYVRGAQSALWFAPDARAAAVVTMARQSVWYQCAVDGMIGSFPSLLDTRFYTYERAPFTYGTIQAPDGAAIPNPDTAGAKVLTLDSSNTYSYLNNLLTIDKPATSGHIRFTHVNGASYLTQGVSVDGLVTILYYDWDDTLIGTQTVQRGDVRKQVNDYVEENFIHPDLRASTHSGADYTDSLAREYTYRGEYDSIASVAGGGVKRPDGDPEPGSKYPLTNKLDYAFYRRATTLVADKVNAGTPNEYIDRYWLAAPVSAGTGDKFPYIFGWAQIEDMKDMENVWTTFGVGELSGTAMDPKRATQNGTLSDGATPVSYTYKTSGKDVTDYFKLVDFSDLSKDKYPGSFVAVKAVYEVGTSLQSGVQYTMTRNPSYTRYNTSTSAVDGAYAISFAYTRVNNTLGYVTGVSRTRSPAVRAQMTPDLLGFNVSNSQSKSFYLRVGVENKEVVDVEISTAAGINKVDYFLVDQYESNFVAGTQRSYSNSYQVEPVPNNFTFSTAANAYDTRQGTPGVVYIGTLNILLEQASKSFIGETNSYTAHAAIDSFNDINLRDANGNAFTLASTARTALTAAVTAAISTGGVYVDSTTGYADLTYHQLQWYIIDGILYDEVTASNKLISWCRQHQTCISSGSSAPKNMAELCAALLAVMGGDTAKEQTLRNMALSDYSNAPFYLRQNVAGRAFSNVDSLVDRLKQAAGAPGFGTGVTLEQLQVWLMEDAGSGATASRPPADALSVAKQSCWWYGGGAKVTNWNGLVAAARTANAIAADAGNPYPDWEAALDTAAATWQSISYYLASDSNGTQYTFAAFKAALRAAVAAFPEATYPTVTWDQVQYYILHSGAVVDDAVAFAEGKTQYWWYNNGKKLTVSSTLAELVAAATNSLSGRIAVLNTLTESVLYDNSNFGFRSTFGGDRFAANPVGSEGNISLLADILKNAVGHANFKPYNSPTITDVEMWAQLQYYILEGTITIATSQMTTEKSNYYWWYSGGDGSGNLPVGTPGTGDTNIQYLMEAVYRYAINKNLHAFDGISLVQITTNLKPGSFRLIESIMNTPPVDWDTDLAEFSGTTGKQEFIDRLIGIFALGTVDLVTGRTYKSLNWNQVQYFLLTGAYLAKTDSNLPDDYQYWWKADNRDPSAGPGLSLLTDYLQAVWQIMIAGEGGIYPGTPGGYPNGTNTTAIENDIKALLEASYKDPEKSLRIAVSTAGTAATAVDPVGQATGQFTQAKTRFINLLKNVINNNNTLYFTPAGGFVFDWYQLQYYSFNNAPTGTAVPKTPAECYDWYWGSGGGARLGDTLFPPVWVPNNVGPSAAPLSVLSFGTTAAIGETNTTVDEASGTTTTTITVTEKAMEDGVLVIRTTVYKTIMTPTQKIETVDSTTIWIFFDGTMETRTEAAQTVTELPQPEGSPAEGVADAEEPPRAPDSTGDPQESEDPADGTGEDTDLPPEDSGVPEEPETPGEPEQPVPPEDPADPQQPETVGTVWPLSRFHVGSGETVPLLLPAEAPVRLWLTLLSRPRTALYGIDIPFVIASKAKQSSRPPFPTVAGVPLVIASIAKQSRRPLSNGNCNRIKLN